MKIMKTICLSISVFILIACSKVEDMSENSNVETITVAQWGSEKYLIYLPFYIAQEKGFFNQKGIEIVLEFSGNDDQVFAKVLREDAHFGIGDPIFTAVSRQRGAKGIVLASIVDRVALWGVSKTNNEVKDVTGFSDLRIGTFPKPSTTYTLLSDSISDPRVKNAEIVEIPIGNELALLESGESDIVMLLEPAASIAEQKGYHVVTSFPEVWGEFAFTGLTSTESIINENPELAKNMVLALQEAVDFAYSNVNETVEIASQLFPNLPEEVVRNAVKRMLDDRTIPKDVRLNKGSWLKSIKVRQAVGDINENNECLECLFKL